MLGKSLFKPVAVAIDVQNMSIIGDNVDREKLLEIRGLLMSLLHVGGASTKNSIKFSSNNYWVESILKDGEINTIYKKVTHKIRNRIGQVIIPVFLYLFINGTISQGNIWSCITLIGVIVVVLADAILECRTDFPKFHAAEHMAHSAHIANKELTEEVVKQESRLSKYCGINFLYFCCIMIVLLVVIDLLIVDIHLLVALIIVIVFVEIYDLNNKYFEAVIKPIKIFGMFSQRILTTRDPDDIHIQVALASMKKLLELEVNREEGSINN